MKAIILAAGRGSRLGSVTEEIPKCLAELRGKTLLSWQLDALRNAGIDEIAIVRGYKKEKLQLENITYFDNDNWQSTNMIMTLLAAKSWLEESDCIVTYSDIVYTSEDIKAVMNAKQDIVLPYNLNWRKLWELRFEDPLSDVESFKVNELGQITEIGQKTASLDDIEGQYMGIVKFTPEGFNDLLRVFENLPETIKPKIDFTSLLNKMIMMDIKLHGIPSNSIWLEVDDQHDLQVYHDHYDEIFALK